MKTLIYMQLIFFLFIIGCESKTIEPNDKPNEVVEVAEHTYARFGEVWYLYSDNKKGDIVVLHRIIVQLKDGISKEDIDFESFGIDEYEFNPLGPDYYLIILPNDIDHITIAISLWNTQWFDYQIFDVMLNVNG